MVSDEDDAQLLRARLRADLAGALGTPAPPTPDHDDDGSTPPHARVDAQRGQQPNTVDRETLRRDLALAVGSPDPGAPPADAASTAGQEQPPATSSGPVEPDPPSPAAEELRHIAGLLAVGEESELVVEELRRLAETRAAEGDSAPSTLSPLPRGGDARSGTDETEAGEYSAGAHDGAGDLPSADGSPPDEEPGHGEGWIELTTDEGEDDDAAGSGRARHRERRRRGMGVLVVGLVVLLGVLVGGVLAATGDGDGARDDAPPSTTEPEDPPEATTTTRRPTTTSTAATVPETSVPSPTDPPATAAPATARPTPTTARPTPTTARRPTTTAPPTTQASAPTTTEPPPTTPTTVVVPTTVEPPPEE